MTPFRMKIGIIHIKNGVRQPEKIIPSNSWVTNMGGALAFIFKPSDDTFALKTYPAGTDLFYNNTSPVRYLGVIVPAAGVTNRSIVVGTSNTTPTRDDFKLNGLIAHGTASGELEYKTWSVDAVEQIVGGYLFTVSRQFDNNSGGSITVEEIGLVMQARTTSAGQSILILHDLLPGGEVIANGDSLITNYHWEFLA